MLGYPPPGTPVAANPQMTEIGADDDGTFFRVTMPLLEEGLTVDGLLLRPHSDYQRKALAVAIHGGWGTAELAAGILDCSSYNYHDMGRKLARRGHLVWLPTCFEADACFNDGVATLDPHKAVELKARLLGTTMTALDLYKVIRSTEIFLRWANLSQAIAVGLSYGGFRALYATALSDQFVACVSSCYVNDRRALLERHAFEAGYLDWYFTGLLHTATDVEIARLICPRPLCVEVGITDNLFPVTDARRIAPALAAIYERFGIGDRFNFTAFDGGHEFSGVEAFVFLERMGL